MNARAIKMADEGRPQKSLITALAVLVAVPRQPYQAVDPNAALKKARGSRVKSIKSRLFEQIVTHLATGYPAKNHNARRAQSFAMATISTGLRPTEWQNAVVRDATYSDVPEGTNPEGILAIKVRTAKRKDVDEEWHRTILVDSRLYQNHILQHMTSLTEAVQKSKDRLNPDKLYIRRCSTALAQACRDLWPKNPGRWITLYSLRSQCRANCASMYGGFVAAAMMGHSPDTSEDYYAGRQRSNLSRGQKLTQTAVPFPHPGPDCLVKAATFETQRSARTQHQSEASAGVAPSQESA